MKMNDYSVFWEIDCIKNLDNNCLKQFKDVMENYAPQLLDRLDIKGSIYTPHDINHCLNIYKCISKIILKDTKSYDKNYGLTNRELFILDLAVLFHDIGMSAVINPDRKHHSKASAEYIDKEYSDNRSCLKRTDLQPLEKKALMAIVKAHSDIKDDPSITSDKNGLNAPDLKSTYEDIQSKNIRVMLLAGILRLADELDVTNARLGNSIIEMQLKELEEEYNIHKNDEKYKEICAGYLESKKHWDKLHLFEMISLDLDTGKIELKVDDDYVNRKDDSGGTKKAVANDIVDVVLKIEKELKAIKEKCFSKKDIRGFIYINSIQVITEIKDLDNEIKNAQSIVDFPSRDVDKTNLSDETKNIENDRHMMPSIIDDDLASKISEEVRERQLLKFGHYRLNDIYCARDWLNVMEIVETRELSKCIVSSIVKHINSRNVNDVVILGMDMVGALLAGRVAFALQKPMSYFVSLKNQEYNSEQDIEFEIKDSENVIIITESIVTFNTIDSAVTKYHLEGKVDSIYTVFYRKTNLTGRGKKYIEKTYSINNDFPIEIVNKEKCIYKNCIATNRH